MADLTVTAAKVGMVDPLKAEVYSMIAAEAEQELAVVKSYLPAELSDDELADFRKLVIEAHRKGMKILIDLVVNHTSSEHPWFKEAIKGKQK